ncbi:4-hydroxy-tetrahydrodipicolinate reductase [uncultured Gammaproteobacteria bacterium]
MGFVKEAVVKIGVVGCAGRMGQMIVRECLASAGCTLAGGSERAGSAAVGKDLGILVGGEPLDLIVTDNAAALFAVAQVVIDFTTPEATVGHAALAAEHGTALVVGTTGLNVDHLAVLAAAGAKVTVVQAANMSLGVNLLLGLVEQVARTLDDGFDIEIVEMHHKHKVDAPSGTALALGRAAATGRGVDLDQVSARVRDGLIGPRRPGGIGFATLRGGDVVGDHTVIFAGDGERVELTHKAGGRQIFARGAVRAALWSAGRAPGLYGMRDVLGV